MGWSSGTAIAADIWSSIEDLGMLESADPAKVKALARKFVALFEEQDCDTLDSIDGPIGWESIAMDLEHSGAPEAPAVGERFTDRWGYTHEHDGKRWREVDEG